MSNYSMKRRPRTIKEIMESMPLIKAADQKNILSSLIEHSEDDFSEDKLLTEYQKVYVIATEDLSYIKIGIAQDIKKRMSNIQSGCPFSLSPWLMLPTPLASKIEAGLHAAFDDYRLNGEWFHLPKEQLSVLADFFEDANKEVKEVSNALLQF